MEEKIDLLYEVRKKLPVTVPAAFFAALFTGVVTHLYMLTNKLPNWDDLLYIDNYAVSDAFGRWFLPYVHPFFSEQSAPALNGTAALVLYAITACLIVLILEVKTVTAAALIGALFVSFPAVVSNMMFMYIGATLPLALLMAVSAVYLTKRFRFGFIAGFLLLFLSMSIYQAYLTVAACLLLLVLLGQILAGEEAKTTLKQGIGALVLLAVSAGVYAVYIQRYDIAAYDGLDQVGSFSLQPITIARAYHRVLQYFVTAPPSFVTPFFLNVYRAVIVVSAGLLLYLFIRRKHLRAPLQCFLLLLVLTLLPLAAGGIYILSPETQVGSPLVTYAYVTLLFVPLLLMEELKPTKKGRVAAFLVTVLLFLAAYGNYRLAGEAYFRASLSFERIENYYNRIIARVEADSDYHYGDKLCIAGDPWPDPNPLSAFNMKGNEFLDLEGIPLENGLFTSSTRGAFLHTYLGIVGTVSDAEYWKIMESEEFQEMPIFPDEGCVRKIGDTYVIKVEH
ncbi:MAG: glucosyltransferase domain-containing protein [Lachnospiraceae bacterium]|nr:glucosyltransferase domain-containing protein [Lachnospiraceae bacterium]MBP3736030.1 glucosyltransferase domain-containing protein [Lachnospiraceae bacterium]